MEQLYEDILNTLEIKPTIELSKRKENKELEPIVEKIKFLLINNINNKKQIENIKENIKKISESHHLRINHLLDDNINENELELALKIIYQTPEIKKLFEKINNYKEDENALFRLNIAINNTQDKKHNVLRKINEIKDIINNRKIIFKKKKIEVIKKEIIKLIEKSKNEFTETYRFEQIEEMLNIKITKNNIEEIIKKITMLYGTIIKELKQSQNAHKKTLLSKRIAIKLPREQLNRILYINEKSYLFTIVSESYRNDKYKKEQLITKIIFILKLINLIEKNKTEQLYKIQEKLKKRETFKNKQNNNININNYIKK